MIRPDSALARRALTLFVVAVLLLSGARPLPSVSTAQTPPAASPPAATTPEIVPLHVVELPPAGNSNDRHILYLMQVTFQVGVNPQSMHQHEGQFVLSIDAGAVCYRQGDMQASTTVTVLISATAGEPNPACGETADLDCEEAADGMRACTLGEDQTIYLPEGSSLTQNGDARHGYGNVDDVPAVVYLAGYQFRTEDAGCSGGCY